MKKKRMKKVRSSKRRLSDESDSKDGRPKTSGKRSEKKQKKHTAAAEKSGSGSKSGCPVDEEKGAAVDKDSRSPSKKRKNVAAESSDCDDGVTQGKRMQREDTRMSSGNDSDLVAVGNKVADNCDGENDVDICEKDSKHEAKNNGPSKAAAEHTNSDHSTDAGALDKELKNLAKLPKLTIKIGGGKVTCGEGDKNGDSCAAETAADKPRAASRGLQKFGIL